MYYKCVYTTNSAQLAALNRLDARTETAVSAERERLSSSTPVYIQVASSTAQKRTYSLRTQTTYYPQLMV